MTVIAIVLLATQLVSGASTWKPVEPPRVPPEVISPEAAAAATKVVELAVRESTEDTTFPTEVLIALDSTSPHVRANALAAVGVAVSSLRNNPSARSTSRARQLREKLRPAVLAGVRDQHGAVRRYAFTTLQSIDFGYDVDFAATVQLANRLFRLDPEPAVRAAALSLIVVEGKSRGRNWSLIEEALDDPSPTVKAVAFQEASSAGAAEAIPYMLRGLNDETDQWTRVSAANALRAFVVTNPEVVDAVAARVDNESNTYIKELLTNVLREMRARKR